LKTTCIAEDITEMWLLSKPKTSLFCLLELWIKGSVAHQIFHYVDSVTTALRKFPVFFELGFM